MYSLLIHFILSQSTHIHCDGLGICAISLAVFFPLFLLAAGGLWVELTLMVLILNTCNILSLSSSDRSNQGHSHVVARGGHGHH